MRILFIGNSFTQRNDLPGLIGALVTAAGLDSDFATGRVVANGAPLRQHWNAGQALESIRQGWDWVVLQEQSTLPVKNAARFKDNVRLFVERVRESGAKLALYQTWARQNAPETQAALTEGYNSIGAEVGAAVFPVGEVWEKVLAAHADIALHDKDGSHPSALGSYLAACVFFARLFQQSPVGLPVPEGLKISAADAKIVQDAAAAIL